MCLQWKTSEFSMWLSKKLQKAWSLLPWIFICVDEWLGHDSIDFPLILVQTLWSHELKNCVWLSWRETFRKDSNVGSLCSAEDCHMNPALLDSKVLMIITANVELILVMCSSPRAGQLLLVPVFSFLRSYFWLKLLRILKCINKYVCVHIYIVQGTTWSLILMAFLYFPFSISASHINWSSFWCLHGSCEVLLSPTLANLMCVA